MSFVVVHNININFVVEIDAKQIYRKKCERFKEEKNVMDFFILKPLQKGIKDNQTSWKMQRKSEIRLLIEFCHIINFVHHHCRFSLCPMENICKYCFVIRRIVIKI